MSKSCSAFARPLWQNQGQHIVLLHSYSYDAHLQRRFFIRPLKDLNISTVQFSALVSANVGFCQHGTGTVQKPSQSQRWMLSFSSWNMAYGRVHKKCVIYVSMHVCTGKFHDILSDSDRRARHHCIMQCEPTAGRCLL